MYPDPRQGGRQQYPHTSWCWPYWDICALKWGPQARLVPAGAIARSRAAAPSPHSLIKQTLVGSGGATPAPQGQGAGRVDATQPATVLLEAECGLLAHLGCSPSPQRDLDLELVEGTTERGERRSPPFPLMRPEGQSCTLSAP